MERFFINEAAGQVGQKVRVAGWVHVRRDHGKIIFIDLRDRSGLLQVVLKPGEIEGDDPEALRIEWVVTIEGEMKERPEAMRNSEQTNGHVELVAEKLEVLNEAKTPPFTINDETAMAEVSEEHRMTYRYLDLRRPVMHERLKIRHVVVQYIRDYLNERGFLEIETPILTKSSPEGARDYIVPSRLEKGSFYSLPQAPQQYKQLLMAAGIERYFQIARCFRDEDTRGDRQPEFTQLDLEMSFVGQEDILVLIEELFTTMVERIFPQKKMKTPWPRLEYDDVIKRYGTDKPDIRENSDDPDELAFAWVLNFPLFEAAKKEGHFVPEHHMFTAPVGADVEKLDSDPASVRSLQHDLVLNGNEIGGGSIRIHDPEVQQKIFDLIGFSEEEASYFSHMLTAFTYGMPPHGGIAPGIDRLLMVLLNQPNIREVIAFPKTSDGRDLMMGAPAPVSSKQLREVGIQLLDDPPSPKGSHVTKAMEDKSDGHVKHEE